MYQITVLTPSLDQDDRRYRIYRAPATNSVDTGRPSPMGFQTLLTDQLVSPPLIAMDSESNTTTLAAIFSLCRASSFADLGLDISTVGSRGRRDRNLLTPRNGRIASGETSRQTPASTRASNAISHPATPCQQDPAPSVDSNERVDPVRVEGRE